MKLPDLDRERSEKKLSAAEFLTQYNEKLPEQFPHASTKYMQEFRDAYPSLFKGTSPWSLDQHRKKFMDWLPMHLRATDAE